MRKVFLGGLPKSVTDDQLKEIFSKYGPITDHVVMKDGRTRTSRGFGFIEFEREDSVDALLNDRPFSIDGREIEIRRAMPKNVSHTTIHEKTRRLFIGGLGHTVTEDDIRKYYTENFSKYGRVESVEVKRDKVSGVSRGFGFIAFDSEDAVDAIILKETRPTIFGRNCEVKKSEPKTQDGGRRGSTRRSPDRFRRSPARRRTREDSRERERMPMFRDYDYGRSPPRDRYPAYDYPDSYDYDRGYPGGAPPAYQHSYSTSRTSRISERGPERVPERISERGLGREPVRDLGMEQSFSGGRRDEVAYGSRYPPPPPRGGEESGYRGGYFRAPY